ncbi:MAG: 1-deoxy-D-xylulose-5-phosphate synthase [Anaerohalosphaeraceae bacterium]|nr:1-deoxy-D-xylulose-5-phosphate synthase [Anaerohalosphaeraceae bacterium]
MEYELLNSIDSPQDLKKLPIEKLSQLADELRDFMTQSISQTGGHLASNLGIIELTIAMHYVFDFKADKLLWDVGHQCYAHKILTGRREMFSKLRQKDGLSGFPLPAESEYDQFSVGHAGTAIPTALGLATACQSLGTDEKIVSLVGDASIVNGVSFEALNNLGLLKRQMLIVLNDNSMAIDVTKGAVAEFLSKVRLSHTYEDMRKTTSRILEHLPVVGKKVENALENIKKTFRMAITRSRLFESLNIPYFGPVDGHDIASLVQLFEALANLDTPAILHVYTKKGKGFTPADDDPTRFHSTGPFEINGQKKTSSAKKTFTDAFGDCIAAIGEKDERVTTITAAMSDGCGLVKFREKFPDRYYDIGIAESIAVDIAAGQAKLGLKPVVCIYSTFLQRGYDQIFQEVSLQNLPVIFCIDRAGLVGSDGPTHHGLMDIGFMRMMPNMVLIAPANEKELISAMEFAVSSNSPVAIRYPKDFVSDGEYDLPQFAEPFAKGRSVTLKNGSGNIAIVAYGSMVIEALKAAEILESDNIDVSVINARFAKPIDEKIISLIASGSSIITVEDHGKSAGFGSAVFEAAASAGCDCAKLITLGIGDEFIEADSRSGQMERVGISAEKIAAAVREKYQD